MIMESKMKAVILAGGEGTRLLPMTERMPKPLVPIANEPTIAHILRLLADAGIHEAVLTLKYRAEELIEYCETHQSFGVSLTYSVEERPLGTAGGVKASEKYLDTDFLVISGDAVCDFSLADAIRFHREKGAVATILTARKKDPTPFGGVVSDDLGRILRFTEKPSWGRVISDRVNTGIYIFSREILDRIPSGEFSDFAKDIFPQLIGNGLYAYAAEGYWCDVGDINAYYACNRDVISGKLKTISPADTHCLAKGARIGEGARLKGRCILGDCIIGEGATVEDSILMDGVIIGHGAHVNRAILCPNAIIGWGVTIRQGSVIGENTIIENGALLPADTRIGAGKRIRSEDMILDNEIFSGAENGIFCGYGLTGSIKTQMTPTFLVKCGAALPFVFGRQTIFFDDGTPSADPVKHFLMGGALSAGSSVTDGGEGFYALASFSTAKSGSDVGIFVKSLGEDLHVIYFFNAYGFPVGTPRMRSLAAAMRRERALEFSEEKIKEDDFYGDYLHYLVDNAKPLARRIAIAEGLAGEAFYAAASLLGASCEIGTKSMAADGAIFVDLEHENELEISYRTAKGNYVMIDRWHATAALIKSRIAEGENLIMLPVTAPHALSETVRQMGGVVKLYDTEASEHSESDAVASGETWQNDMLHLALLYLSELGVAREPIYSGVTFATAEKTIRVSDASLVIGMLASHGADTENGMLLLRFADATVRVTASDAQTLTLFAEAKTPRDAEDGLRYAEKGIIETTPTESDVAAEKK